jgi:DNA-binding GntR family transcriptional regulator
MTTPHLPAYQRVVESIKDDIRSKRVAVGDKLPGNRTLAETKGVALATLQKALKALHDEGWVTVTPAVGVYVNEPPSEDQSAAVTMIDVLRQVEELRIEVSALRGRVDDLEGTGR